MDRTGAARGELATLSGVLGTGVCAMLTVLALSLLAACTSAPAEGTLRCRRARDCPAPVPVCRCDGRCWAAPAPPPDAGAADAGAPSVRTYVLAAIRSGVDGAAYGVDLDGRDDGTAGTCTDQPDLSSSDTHETGIDNQFLTVVGLLDWIIAGDGWDGALADAIDSGRFAIVLEVGEVAGDVCARRVHAWTARPVSGAAPDLSGECNATPTQRECASDGACTWFASRGRCAGLAPGQAWVALDDLGEARATVIAGRFRTEPLARLPLAPFITPVGHPGMLAPIDLHDVVIEADLGADVLVRGDIGGAIHMSDAVSWLNTYLLGDRPTDLATLTSFVFPDLAPSADGQTCADFSAGFGFTAIEASLTH